ncbi:sugar transferase [Pseudogracilibacillus auburnensis]|uniref:Exopolysaccharide biosynthesis polyprenyl glycosylphosphotransferase n=1 Tax=Pseudogracilibacillus auburnensis TaxID=1494959 RepID=A0A2V3VHX2_9BACI|nr:exopolysaccharide biosynthesis polyprenyl glycosylphosphotransferase [Pseudogracilibacillus auburnensis]PXW80491.1 exopolysaccharide biosynthesis polyprenyl glycosylphosphotransferase [Pseudogracilibacillus auburnensis]
MRQIKANEKNLYEEYIYIVEMPKLKDAHHNTYYMVGKRFIDLFISILLLPKVLVVILLFSILIKIESPGPVLFLQERVGRNGEYFKVIKLRSMFMNEEANETVWTKKDDPRITRIGKFIRKTRIDELPQIFNVLKGEMSIIGPRPEQPLLTAKFEQKYPGFIKRLIVKPGITGWAQVNGGYELSPDEKMNLDFYYIQNKSALLDMKIMLKTMKVVVTGDGAR